MLRILIAVFLLGAILGCGELEDNRAAKYRAAVERGYAEAETAFKAWNGSTIDDESQSVVLWSGATSEILFIEFRPGISSALGHKHPETWIVWARSASGTIYKTIFFLDLDLNMISSNYRPEVTTMKELLHTLHSAGRMDVIKKLGFAVKVE